LIHPSAIIDPHARIGENVTIGPYSVINQHVTIGDNTIIGPHAVIDSYTDIGPDCHIFQFAAIGAAPQALKYEGEETRVTIGRGTVVREFATIHRGTVEGGGVTRVGEENFLMAYIHIAHDCQTGRRVVMSNNATLAGHIVIGDYATIGGLVAIHQFVRIGNHAFIGGKSAVVKDVPPYVMAVGDRARLRGLNTVGLKRRAFSPETVSLLKKVYRILFRFGLTLNEALERVRAEVEPIPEVTYMIDFIKSSQRGITR
jgi:UDP-N-acetylglucosamine acyltransferase